MPKYATRQRKILTDYLLRHADEELSARNIAQALAEQGISISAVYRNLAQLEAEGKVRRLPRGGSRELYYRYTDADACKKHLHMSCSKCGKTYHMDIPATDMLIKSVAQDADFEIDSANTVLYGVCRDCLKKA